MKTDLVESPFGARGAALADSAGVRQNQSREMAETQVKYLMAQRFPRDVVANTDKILNAFTRPTLAEKAAYQFARGGSDITGPSIRAAEAIAQQWGNLEQGFRELSRGIDPSDGVPFSEVEAFCVDLEARTSKRLQFIVRHWRDTKSGGYKLKDERDIYELVANQAQRRVRACILSTIPGDVTEAAMNQADVTLRTKADTSPEAMKNMVIAFEQFGVTQEQIVKRIQRRLDAIQPAQVVSLKRIWASLRDDMSTPEDWFEPEASADGTMPSTGAAGLKERMSARKNKDSVPKAKPKADEKPDSTEQKTAQTANDYIGRLNDAGDVAAATALLVEARNAGMKAADLKLVQDAFDMAFTSGPADQQ